MGHLVPVNNASAQLPISGPELMEKAERFGEPGGLQSGPIGVEDPREFAKFAGISPDSRFYRAILKQEIPATLGHENDALSSGNIIAHVRGKEGREIAPLPPEEMIKKAARRMVEEARGRELVKKQLEEEVARLLDDLKLAPLPECRRDQTLIEELSVPAETKSGPATLVSDVIFISKGNLPPLSRDYFFGEKTNIVVYDHEKPTIEAYAARHMDVTCLPTRRRLTNKFHFTHFGRDALMNFDQDLHGKGDYLLPSNRNNLER